MRKVKKKAKEQATKVAETLIQNCTFNGSDSAGVLALAKAIEANAEAIKALAAHVAVPSTLLHIGALKENWGSDAN
jgi:hypothetical protein